MSPFTTKMMNLRTFTGTNSLEENRRVRYCLFLISINWNSKKKRTNFWFIIMIWMCLCRMYTWKDNLTNSHLLIKIYLIIMPLLWVKKSMIALMLISSILCTNLLLEMVWSLCLTNCIMKKFLMKPILWMKIDYNNKWL